MGGLRRPRTVPERVYADHRTAEAVAHRRLYAVLVSEFPLTTALLRYEASRVATLGVLATKATRALCDAQRARANGRGRRPSPREIERLARRQGLADASYSQALDKLRGLAAHRTPTHPDELLARAHAEMRRAHEEAE